MSRVLSPSQVNTYLKCGIMWQFRYIDGIKNPPAGAMIKGRALDEASNLHYMSVALSAGGLSQAEFVDQAVTTYDDQITQVENESLIEKGVGKDELVIASRAYHTDIATKITPRSKDDIQKRTQKDIGGVEVVGIVDLIITSKVGPWITDTKLKGKKPSESEVERSIQLTTYSLLEEVPRTSLLVVNSKGQTNVVKAPPKLPSDYDRITNFYQNTLVNIEKGVAVPAPPGAWWCSDKWCGYWERCPFGAAGRVGVRQPISSNVFLAPRVELPNAAVNSTAEEGDPENVD